MLVELVMFPLFCRYHFLGSVGDPRVRRPLVLGGGSSWLGLLYEFMPFVLFVPLYLSFEFFYPAELGIF